MRYDKYKDKPSGAAVELEYLAKTLGSDFQVAGQQVSSGDIVVLPESQAVWLLTTYPKDFRIYKPVVPEAEPEPEKEPEKETKPSQDKMTRGSKRRK